MMVIADEAGSRTLYELPYRMIHEGRMRTHQVVTAIGYPDNGGILHMGSDRLRPIGRWEDAEVRRRHQVIPTELPQLGFVERPIVWRAMTEQHERAIAGVDEEQAHPMAIDVSLGPIGSAHARARQQRRRKSETERRA
jgi:hypothetical protein